MSFGGQSAPLRQQQPRFDLNVIVSYSSNFNFLVCSVSYSAAFALSSCHSGKF